MLNSDKLVQTEKKAPGWVNTFVSYVSRFLVGRVCSVWFLFMWCVLRRKTNVCVAPNWTPGRVEHSVVTLASDWGDLRMKVCLCTGSVIRRDVFLCWGPCRTILHRSITLSVRVTTTTNTTLHSTESAYTILCVKAIMSVCCSWISFGRKSVS